MIVVVSKVIIPVLIVIFALAAGHNLIRLIHVCRTGAAIAPVILYSLSFALFACLLYILAYGVTIGFRKLDIKRIEYASADLPKAFDGYKIVHFSDIHLGTYGDDVSYVRRAVDSINAQDADLIVFTGDIQNVEPSEVRPFEQVLASLKARDGVISIMGNHDYGDYFRGTPKEKIANEHELMAIERRMGWTLLCNETMVIRRDSDSIVIAGMENDGEGHFFNAVRKAKNERFVSALSEAEPSPFAIMLQHDPSSWRRTILPLCSAQLTLSGHTHATQLILFGWSPSQWLYREWGGMFYEGSRAINVSTGLGGFIPFRFGVPGEVVTITLRANSSPSRNSGS